MTPPLGVRPAHVFTLSNGDVVFVVPFDKGRATVVTVGTYGIHIHWSAAADELSPGFQIFGPESGASGRLPGILHYGIEDVRIGEAVGEATENNPFERRRVCHSVGVKICCVENGALRIGTTGPWVADDAVEG